MTTITVTVDGKKYDTFMDERGVQRFVPNMFVCWMLDGGHLDLNEISIAYRKATWLKRGYQEFHMALGYSVCGFADLWPAADIENSLWHAGDTAAC
jgi:hypothetical protein